MPGFHTNIEERTSSNANFRSVIFTGGNMQLVLMSLKPQEDIGMETHGVDQFFRFGSGNGKVIVGGVERNVGDGDIIIVPAGTPHDVINTSTFGPLKFYTIYSPPNHPDGTVHRTKEEAEIAEGKGRA